MPGPASSRDVAVVVATVRALKSHSGKYKVVAGRPLPEEMLKENPEDVMTGAANLRKQLENIRAHGVEPVVAINAMPSDFASERDAIHELAASMGVRSAVGTHFADGGRGATEIAEAVAEVASKPNSFRHLYPSEATLKEKIEALSDQTFTAPTAWTTPPWRASSSTATRRTASATCRSASPRPSTA